MKKFWYIFQVVWIERMAYRVNFLLEGLSGTLSSLIVVLLWMAVYRANRGNLIGGYSIEEMITYLLGGGLINGFILATAENPEASENIQDGTLSSLLIQPLHPYAIWFFRDAGNKAFHFLTGAIGYIVILVFFRNYLVICPTFGNFIYFLLSLVIAALLQFFLFQGLSLLSFWIENTYGIRFTVRVVMEVVGGAIIPISFFPEIVRDVFLLLPFPFIIYAPMRIYLGKVAFEEIPQLLLIGLCWVTIFVFFNWLIWKKGIRQYVSMGD